MCEEAGCPNIFECWEDREATFLIGGEQCTRRCDFCQIDTGKPAELDRDEPRRVAQSVAAMGLKYATITGVARDDLPDGGAWLYAETVRAIKELNPSTGVELLAPDFNGDPALLRQVFDSRPEVFAHNLETVPRIFKRIRPAFRYQRSLDVLTAAREFGLVTKSNLILGMGETVERCTPRWPTCTTPAATSSPSPSICGPRRGTTRSNGGSPRGVRRAGQLRRGVGIRRVLAGPLVRSSYRAGRLYAQAAATHRLPDATPARDSQHLRIPTAMAKSRTPAQTKAAKPKPKPHVKPPRNSAAPSCGRRSRCSARKTAGCCPYMVGAFVVIVAASVAVGLVIGGFTRYLMIVFGVVLGVPSRSSSSVGARRRTSTERPRAGRGRRLGPGQPSRQVAGDTRRRSHRASRRRAPGDRPAGVIFVGEGSPARVKPLLAQEKKRTARLIGEIPIYDVIIGNGEGEVPLAKLERHLTRLPANITVKQMDILESKLTALGSRMGPAAAMPKGPLPSQAKMRGAADRPPALTPFPVR